MAQNSHLCAFMALSAIGMLLMPVFGLLLRLQPKFVHGLHVNSSTAETNCYIVGGLYAGIFLVCCLVLTLKICHCYKKKSHEFQDDVSKRNYPYGLPFVELESKEFIKAMEAMDRRTVEVAKAQQALELPTTFAGKADTV